ncbi:MAG: ABC transporter permease [Eubacterium sp.]|nr:ABC transporter permease [Eubacterium sp.]
MSDMKSASVSLPVDDGWTEEDFRFAVREESIQTDEPIRGDSFMKVAVKRFVSKKTNMFGLILLFVLILLSIIGPYLSGYGYNEQHLERANMAPHIPLLADGTENMNGNEGKIRINRYEELGIDTYYLFGTDKFGRDLFSRCFMGLRISILIALIATLINLAIGMNYGMISGYIGGRTDSIMQRITDIFSSIPALVIVTLMMLILKPGFGAIILALMVTGWMEMSIVARVQVLRLKDREFVLAARTLGAGRFFILSREILPNIMGPMMTEIMVLIPNAIFMETFLSFVGLGMPVGSCSLGALISAGFQNCLMHPYQLVPCVVLLVLLMIACNLVGDGIRDAFEKKA